MLFTFYIPNKLGSSLQLWVKGYFVSTYAVFFLLVSLYLFALNPFLLDVSLTKILFTVCLIV